jgi:hypothetical protein
MATLPNRRVAILVFLLLCFCVSAPARQTPASAVWDVPVKLDRDQAIRLDGSNTMAASRPKDAN